MKILHMQCLCEGFVDLLSSVLPCPHSWTHILSLSHLICVQVRGHTRKTVSPVSKRSEELFQSMNPKASSIHFLNRVFSIRHADFKNTKAFYKNCTTKLWIKVRGELHLQQRQRCRILKTTSPPAESSFDV